MSELTPRQQREKEYHEQFANLIFQSKSPTIDFTCVDSLINNIEHRPWNEYWYIQELVLKQLQKNGAKNILDVGCGSGDYTLSYAKMGFQVETFDICEKYIEITKQLAIDHHLSDKINVKIGVAEHLEYPDNYFDVIAGIDILHHVNITDTISECFRVLKPGGIVFFREPVESTIFDIIRNSKFIKKFFPNQMSFENYITEDEKKLNSIKAIFPNMEIKYFRIFSRLDKFQFMNKTIKYWAKFDQMILKYFPVQSLAGVVILQMKK
jgi:2-polyprenyl-3-methyl-5-hydroxy-6-metoxy-1,4-benzoquinol methylase